jgi:putative heme-binding domain-containing protein
MKSLWFVLHPVLILATSCLLQPLARAADTKPAEADRFTPPAGFSVEEVVTPGSTGSLVAMAFDEQGNIIASRERGPLLLIQDKDGDGKFETVGTYCDKVSNCQGILPWGKYVFAIGEGPSNTAFYRLSDTDHDGQADKVETLFKFRGGMGEHGPHAPILGPDGLIYIIMGNHTFVAGKLADTSPHHHFYDAELINPKYEDANGHASGIKAPGGSVVRTDADGSFLELFVGGFRNAYDHAFNRDGELFTYDSDMEWDVGLPWYRPTRVNHLIPGAEFGWRSGWSKWPAYYVDSLPATLDIGRGSPTGVVFYDHHRFPEKYQGAFFMCDWSQGRVLAVFLEPDRGTYKATSEIFLEGRPLNCSDIDVGPDGWLYICVGGRNTEGSIFRVVSDASARQAAADKPARRGITRAIEQPQLASAWARRAVRDVKNELGDEWGPALRAVAINRQAPAQSRVRALDLMQLYSPAPPAELLVNLSHDENVRVRSKATYLMGIHATPATNDRLVALLDDADPSVRRLACASLVRARHAAPVDKLLKLVASPDRFVAWEARRALEALPRDEWQSIVLSSPNARVFIQGAVALEVLGPDRDTCRAILDACAKWLDAGPSDDNVLDLLRVTELALYRGGFKPGDQPALRGRISARYPSTDDRLNRELVRTLVMMQEPTLAPRLAKYLQSHASVAERIQAAMLGVRLKVGWTPELRGELLDFLAFAQSFDGGNSYRGYLANGAGDVLKDMPAAEQLARIRQGAKKPGAALGVVQHLSGKLSPEQVAALMKLDVELAGNHSAEARELAQATIIALGHGDESVLPHLHAVFENAPDRRHHVAQALATYSLGTKPRDEDWPLLVRSLTVVEGATARDVLRALGRYNKKDDKPQDQRQVILLGLQLGDNGGREAARLLLRWTGEAVSEPREPGPQAMAKWQKWFAQKYPDQPEAVLPAEPEAKQVYAAVLDFLGSPQAAEGDPERGAAVFEKAQCIKCHRYGTRGEGIGPDLTNVSRRFQRKEILESVVFPSLVISDQFAGKTVLTTDGKVYAGLVGETGDGIVVLQTNGEKVNVAKADIEKIAPSKQSAMPGGLFDKLSQTEIADLFAYLAQAPQEKADGVGSAKGGAKGGN